MVDLAPGSVISIVNPNAAVGISAPGLVEGIWYKEGPTGPPGSTDRATHTGYQVAATISDFNAAADARAVTVAGVAIVDSTESGGAVWKVGPTAINVRQYGVAATNTAGQNDTAMASLFADYTGAVFVAFPDTGTFQFSQPFAARNHLQVLGRGRQTILNWSAGNMLAISGTTLMQSARFADVQITNSGTASHLVSVAGSGGLIHTVFERCDIHLGINGASILNADTYNLFGIQFRDCLLARNLAATVPAINIVGQTGAGTNNIHFEGGEWHSNECSSSPFVKIDAGGGSPIINLTFEKIVGEQNHGGMIHAGGVTAVRVRNVIDFDSTTYADDLFKFTTSTDAQESNGVDIDHAGTYGAATLGGGKVHLRITGGVSHKVGWIPKNGSQAGTILLSTTKGNSFRRGGTEVAPFELVSTLPLTINSEYHSVAVTVAGTLTLPASPATGQTFRIKAIGGAGCTVSGNTANIDGTATKVLAQYDVLNVVWSGSTWLKF